jgi:hypothetical protein
MMPLSIDFANLHTILATLYDEMLPLCEDMMDVGKGLAGLGALFYVAVRVWQSMARAEPIDVYPLLRPFAIGICILLFPTLVLGTLNNILSPIVQGTHKMLEGQTMNMEQYRIQKEELEKEAMLRNPETAYLVSDEEFDRQLDELGWSTIDTACSGCKAACLGGRTVQVTAEVSGTACLHYPACYRRHGEVSDNPDQHKDDVDTVRVVYRVVRIVLQFLNVILKHQYLKLGKQGAEQVADRKPQVNGNIYSFKPDIKKNGIQVIDKH